MLLNLELWRLESSQLVLVGPDIDCDGWLEPTKTNTSADCVWTTQLKFLDLHNNNNIACTQSLHYNVW